MMFVKPDGKIDLEHRACVLRGVPQRSVVIAAAGDGQLSILSPDLEVIQVCRLPSKGRAVSPHPLSPRLAWVDGKTGSLTLQQFDGLRHLEITPPKVKEAIPNWIQRGFDDCFFSEDGNFLWTIAPWNSQDVVVQLHEAETGATIHSAKRL
ncbi:hypothetical protein AYO40_01810 [Planctomycetaceae bacterium SCGC AG-212-D15]|nr:hypothetical protein AYO40_01810 [Planctomycetaceae bacterium SCGC AG-212-D15]